MANVVVEEQVPWFKRPLVISAVLAGLSALIGHVYLRRYETQLSGGDRVPLLFVTAEVAAGDVLSKTVLAARLVPLAYVDERDVRAHDLEKVVGIEASFNLAGQQTLQWSDLAVRPDSRQVSQLVVPGKRAVAVRMKSLDADTAHLVRPGDYVDVLATLSADGDVSNTVLLQRVLVVAVGEKTERSTEAIDKDNKRKRVESITLSLDLEESQLLALGEARGELSIAIRNADDQRLLEDVPDLRAENLLEAQQALVARRNARIRPTATSPIRLTEAK
jgi:pilus assembly protein CpaB